MSKPPVMLTHDLMLDFDDVMLVPSSTSLSSRSQVELEREFTFKNGTTWRGVPIVAANMDSTGTFEVCRVLSRYKMITALHKFYTPEEYKTSNLDPEYFMVSTGITDLDFKRLLCVSEVVDMKWICIDVANGYMECFVDFCEKVRKAFPDKILVAGNVATSEAVDRLLGVGVDIVKVGIGSGSACLTRKKTGVGIPQFSAVSMCRQRFIMSDGGIRSPGDVVKAFGAGADFVMIGGEFAGHDENPGEIVEGYKLFYGMSSEHAMNKNYGVMNSYRSSEGVVLKVKYKGALERTVQDYLGGLRSACTYIGADTLEQIPAKAVFARLK